MCAVPDYSLFSMYYFLSCRESNKIQIKKMKKEYRFLYITMCYGLSRNKKKTREEKNEGRRRRNRFPLKEQE